MVDKIRKSRPQPIDRQRETLRSRKSHVIRTNRSHPTTKSRRNSFSSRDATTRHLQGSTNRSAISNMLQPRLLQLLTQACVTNCLEYWEIRKAATRSERHKAREAEQRTVMMIPVALRAPREPLSSPTSQTNISPVK